MSWKVHFQNGMKDYRVGKAELAVESFTKALEANPDRLCLVYDARSSALEKVGRHQEALKDVRKTIELAPTEWPGYLKAARLFNHLRKYDNAMKMVDMALNLGDSANSSKRSEMQALRSKIIARRKEYIRQSRNHSEILPLELFAEIVFYLTDVDPATVTQLSHVCQYWRTVVFSNPLFWRTLVLGRSRQQAKAKLWMEQSNGKVRELRVVPGALDTCWSGEGLEGLQWETLRICSIAGWDLCQYLRRINKLNALTSLESYEFFSQDSSSDSRGNRMFEPTWPIQHLSLMRAPMPEHFNELSHNSIVSLSLRQTTSPTLLSLVPFTSLETLILEGDSRQLAGYPGNLVKMKRLELIRARKATNILLTYPMPDLQVLRVQYYVEFLDDSIYTLVRNGVAQLTDLTLHSLLIGSSRCLIQLLQDTPLLQKLDLTGITCKVDTVVDAFGVELTTRVDGEQDTPSTPYVLCPELQNINFSRCHGVRTGGLARMVRARNSSKQLPGCSRIETLTVDGCEEVDPGQLVWFRNMVPDFGCVYRTIKDTRKTRR
ncbi:hypothetical protein FA15DRAFT_612968 [Coprinopsis marcescibilis]|uniref:F-box domain-containing protein n=1 Tax=Coprinopsis marcescibilis TaxID=230819 RepID=A0A5C3L5V8_COPMA|nr:hypothetical protein FA15DRAFT_612968 [Coprinopsis marcescibilis]